MKEIARVTPRDDYLLEIEFIGGQTELIDVKPLLLSPAFQPARDKEFFSRVQVDCKFGGVVWPNGIDICIDWIEAQLERQNHVDEFTQAITDVEERCRTLIGSEKYSMSNLPKQMPSAGIYTLSEKGSTLYVGRTDNLRRRLKEHTYRDGKKAAFAVLLARELTGKKKATYRKEDSLKDLLNQKGFQNAFNIARERIQGMEVQFIEEPDSIRQALLEICVSVRTNAKYSRFDNH